MDVKRALGFALMTALACALLSFAGCGKKPAPPPASSAAPAVTIEYETLPSLVFEAEDGLVNEPVQLYDDASASGGKYALAPEGPDHKEISIGGDVTYRLDVPEEGEYVVWFRAKWAGACGNSLGVLLDGEELGAVGDAVYEKWHWVRLGRRKVRVAKGAHTLVVQNREDGSAFDQVLLTQDGDYRPTGIEKADVKGRTLLKNTVPADEKEPQLPKVSAAATEPQPKP